MRGINGIKAQKWKSQVKIKVKRKLIFAFLKFAMKIQMSWKTLASSTLRQSI